MAFWIFISFAVLIGLPVLAYFVAKFATTGFLKAKQRFKNQQRQHKPKEINEQTRI